MNLYRSRHCFVGRGRELQVRKFCNPDAQQEQRAKDEHGSRKRKSRCPPALRGIQKIDDFLHTAHASLRIALDHAHHKAAKVLRQVASQLPKWPWIVEHLAANDYR